MARTKIAVHGRICIVGSNQIPKPHLPVAVPRIIPPQPEDIKVPPQEESSTQRWSRLKYTRCDYNPRTKSSDDIHPYRAASPKTPVQPRSPVVPPGAPMKAVPSNREFYPPPQDPVYVIGYKPMSAGGEKKALCFGNSFNDLHELLPMFRTISGAFKWEPTGPSQWVAHFSNPDGTVTQKLYVLQKEEEWEKE